MEATEQGGIETAARGQKTQMSNWRMSFIGVTCLTAFYVAWGIVKMIS